MCIVYFIFFIASAHYVFADSEKLFGLGTWKVRVQVCLEYFIHTQGWKNQSDSFPVSSSSEYMRRPLILVHLVGWCQSQPGVEKKPLHSSGQTALIAGPTHGHCLPSCRRFLFFATLSTPEDPPPPILHADTSDWSSPRLILYLSPSALWV